jgi:hypothetical protein
MGLAVFEALVGGPSGVQDPRGEIFAGMRGHTLMSHREVAVDAAAALEPEIPQQ